MQHVIRKQIIELRLQKNLNAFRLQHKISQDYWDTVCPALSDIFDSYTHQNEVINLDKLEIDLGVINNKSIYESSWVQNISEKISQALRSQLLHTGRTVNANRKSLNLNIFQQWLFYIEHGYFPWNTTTIDQNWEKSIIKTLESNPVEGVLFFNLIKRSPQLVLRIVMQHNPWFLSKLVELISSKEQSKLVGLVENISKQFKQVESLQSPFSRNIERSANIEIWNLIIRASLENPMYVSPVQFLNAMLIGGKALITPEQLPDEMGFGLSPILNDIEILLRQLEIFMPNSDASEVALQQLKSQHADFQKQLRKKGKSPNGEPANPQGHSRNLMQNFETSLGNIDKLIDNDLEEQSYFEIIDKDGIFVSNAGVVLLHPFLTAFYGYIDLMEGSDFHSLEQRQKAVVLLYYMVTGDTLAPEFELTIFKLLCAYPANLPIDTISNFSEQEISECETLLSTVIERWEVLKGSSLDALREDFLQRGGHLYRKNDRICLRIEQRSIDVLLDYIPWTLSMIKLPWMKELLYVEWR